MIPDVNLKSYYLQYISNANTDIITYKENLLETQKIKEELHNYIESYIDVLKNTYNINLLDYNKEWVNKEYNDLDSLYTKAIKVNNIPNADNSNRIVLLQLIKYCNLIKVENKYNKLILLCNTRKNIRFSEYSKYVTNYYNVVHKTVLQGMGYTFAYGIGTYCINHWKLDKDKMNKTKRIDFNATNIKKRELIANGVKIYDDKQAAWYAARKIPYDGVDYRVYKTQTSFYEFAFIRSTILSSSSIDYKRTEYVALRYRNMSYTQIADKFCKTIEDIYNLQVDIKYKLNMIIYKNPNVYLNFIRNADQCKYKRGAHNS